MFKAMTLNIMVKNVAETLKFYEDKLGFEKVLSVPEEAEKLDFVIMKKDEVTLMLQEQENLRAEYETVAQGEIVPTFTMFINVDDVKQLYEELKGKVELAKDLHKTFYGQDEFAIFDNNGNILTLAQG